MRTASEIDKRLKRLKSADPQTRDLAAAELGASLEAGVVKAERLADVVHTLTGAALGETDATAREQMFDALSFASSLPGASDLDWDPIAATVDELPTDCLEHALIILGDSGQARYRPKIERYLTHPDEDIRTTARDA